MNYNANIHYDNLSALNSEVKAARDQLNALQSALDRKVADIYHDIERKDLLSMSESHSIMGQLKKTLEHRRVVKDELKRLDPLFYFLRENIPNIESQHEKAKRIYVKEEETA